MTISATLHVALAFGIALGRAAAQPVDVPPDAMIRLERTSCYGPCPIYTVTIDARGTVTYDGAKHVRVVGRRTAQVDPAVTTKLLAGAERIRFFDLRDAYRVIEHSDGSVSGPTDLPTRIVTITVNGRTKRVEDYVGAPDSMGEFEHDIDEAAGTKRWTFLDEETLEKLLRSGWSASGDEGATLLHQAFEQDDLAIARRLIETGANLDGPRDNRLPPLYLARSGSMVNLLVRAGANPNERLVGRATDRTPLMSAAYKDATFADALVKAGARLEDLEGGRTALWYAACAGNWRVVTVLVGAGANSRGSAAMSASDCARKERQSEASRRRTVLDRGRPTATDFDQVIAVLENAEKRQTR